MRIDFQKIDRESFMVHQHEIFDEIVYLIQPVPPGAKYDKNTTIFRSSVWDREGNLVSPSFKKFWNANEIPFIDPLPDDISDGCVIEKVDGSTAIFSLLKGNLIVRTRGTVDASKQKNAHEFKQLTDKYNIKSILENLNKHSQTTLLFELTSPTQRIIIDYGPDPELWLIGAIHHEDYSYFTQVELDGIAEKYGLKRPRKYLFSTLTELSATVDAFRGIEGVCFYYNKDQCIRKFKSIDYLYHHRAKSEVSNIDKVVDLYISEFVNQNRYLSYKAFMAYLEKMFDYEIAELAKEHVLHICAAMEKVDVIVKEVCDFSESVRKLPRKDSAAAILKKYNQPGWSTIAFKYLDRKQLCAAEYKKILQQLL